ncbi:MAG: hypothetical protein JST32_11745 [Bacteroidetes bacterium]|nr:hypothetical protein [Bacteroidota bacterium]
MRYSLFIIAVLFVFAGCKDSLNDKDKRNENWVWWVDAKTGKAGWIHVGDDRPQVQNGKYTRFYFNGNIYEKGKLIDGENVDTTFYYDTTGRLQDYSALLKNTSDHKDYFYKNGPIRIFNPNGSISAIGIVKNHDYGDRWISYFDNGKTRYVRNMKNDTGWSVDYYDNGKIQDSEYSEGTKVFTTRYFYSTGQLKKSIEFKNHAYNGLQKEYYLNGQLKAICPRINGEFTGKQKLWYEDGHLMEVDYKKGGKLEGGPDTLFYESGKVKKIVYAKNDKLDGEAKEFDESGKLILDRIFEEGVVIEDKLIPSILTRH